MKSFYKSLLLLGGLLPMSSMAQLPLVTETLPNPDNEPVPVQPVPHPRQLKWQETEFYAFFHYGMNTYTGLEWGNGDEAETRFAPTAAPNPKQWLQAAKDAGMKGGIAVVKHHDGFCLWPTETTTHNVTQSGNDFGRNTNIPRDFAAAAKELGMKYGFYISPWDRNSVHYGTDKYVKDVFLKQCAELAQYGTDQFEMWFDAANGGSGYYGGRNTTVNVDRSTYYDVPNLRDSVHKVCPDCVLWGVGGEARWIGNEAGWAGETNWSTENRDYAGENNGMYGTEGGWFWLPGESDAKATNRGWFYHDGEAPLTPERLFQMYLETVGRNATLILNFPPNKAGVLPDQDVTVLRELGEMLQARLGTDKALTATAQVSEQRADGQSRTYAASNLNDGNIDTYWAPNDGQKQATITLTWSEPQTLYYVALQEYIQLGQRVKSFTIETSANGTDGWTRQGGNITTSTIGYKRIIPLNGSTSDSYKNPVTAKAVRITINDAKDCPCLHTVSVF